MKYFKQIIVSFLVIAMTITALPVVRAEDEVPTDDAEISAFEPGPILNEPVDYSANIVIDEDTEVESGGLLNSRLRRKVEEDIDSLLNFKPIDSDSIITVIKNVDNFVLNGGLDVDRSQIGAILTSSSELSAMANAIGLQDTGEELIDVIETDDNATGYIFVVDRNSIAVRVEDRQGTGIEKALVTISYKDASGNTVTRAQYTTEGSLPGLCGFDKMVGIDYILIDVQADGYRAQTILDKRVTPGDILYFRLQDSPADDIYLRCVDMGGKDMLMEDTGMYLVESGSRVLDMRVIVTAKGNKTLPDKISLNDNHTERNITDFTDYSRIDLGGAASRIYTKSADWMKKGNLLQEDDVLFFNLSGTKEYLELVRVKNALLQPGTSEEELPLVGADKKVPLTDIMGGSGIVSLTFTYLKIPVTVGYFPEGGFIIVATFDIEKLSNKYSSLFEESWNPKTRAETESVFEPFKQEFWRKADRFKDGTGQMNDSKRVSFATDKYWSLNVSFSLFCTGVHNDKTGNFEGSFGGMFDVKIQGGITQYFLVSTPIVIPFYLGFDIFGEFKSSISTNFMWNKLSDGISAAFAAADHHLVERHDILAGLELYAGVGLKGACSLEAAGGASLDFAFINGTIEEYGDRPTRFLIDSFASIRVSGSIAFFSFNLFNKAFGPWRLHDTHPDKPTGPLTEDAQEEIEFIDMDLSAVSEKGTLLFAGNDEVLNHYRMDVLNSEVTTVNDIQTISAISNDTFSDSQVQIVSTGKTTAMFRIASVNGKARVIYQKQDPDSGVFTSDYYELPALMGYDVTEFDVAASTTDDNLFYVGCVVADSSKPDIESRSLTTRVQGIVVDLDTDTVRSARVKSPLPDAGKYYYFNPRVAGRDGKIAVAYQRTPHYKALDMAVSCVFGTNEKETVMGKGSIYSSGDIVKGEPSFFLTNREHTTSMTAVIDGYMADGSFDEKNPRCRYSVDVHDYQLQENEFYLTNWGYANNTNYAVIAGKLYFLEKYADSYDSYGYGMRLTEVENSEGLVNRDNIYEFVVTDDKSGICIVSATSSYDVNMETGASKLTGSTLKVYTLEGRYDSSTQTNQAILHGPLDIFVKNADISVFAAVFNRENCRSKGLSVVYATTPEETLLASGKVSSSSDIYQWQQNLKRGLETTNVEFADLFYYTDEHILPVTISFRNIGYAIEGTVAFTIKDENGYDMHELYYNEGNKNWYDLGNEVDHNVGRLYSGDSGSIELIVAAPYYWEANRVHEVHVEMSSKYRGDVRASFTTPVFRNSLTLQGKQIALGDKHYADLSITNIAGEDLSLNKLAVATMYADGTKSDHITHLDLARFTSEPDLDKYSLRFDLTSYWERAEEEGILAVRFYLTDENDMPLTGESVIMLPVEALEIEDVSYEITEGADGVWVKGSEEGHLLKVVRSRNEETCFSHFTAVSIDGNVITLNEDYLAESGSTLITLQPEMLEQLSEGEHDVLISFDDGEAETTLTIKANKEDKPDEEDVPPVEPDKPDSPDTGDINNIWFWLAAMNVSAAGALWLVFRRRSYNE